MTTRTQWLATRVMLACLSLVVACSSAGSSPAAGQPGTATASELVAMSFALLRDSSGVAPKEHTSVTLAFEPDGRAHLLVADDQDALAYAGTYAYDGGKITLAFHGDDFHPSSTFALDVSQDTVTMPFQVFSTDPGSSTWTRSAMSLPRLLFTVFQSVTLEESLPTEQALDRVVAHANAFAAVAGVHASSFRPSRDAIRAQSLGSWWTEPKIKTVGKTANGVILTYEDGDVVEVVLFGRSVGSSEPLAMSPLAGDPRVHIDPTTAASTADDPDEKTSLHVVPFHSERVGSWYDYYFVNGMTKTPAGAAGVNALADNVEDATKWLADRGYKTTTLFDGDATVEKLVDALTSGNGGRLRSPGLVDLSTHGSGKGSLALGVYLCDDALFPTGKPATTPGDPCPPAVARQGFAAALARLPVAYRQELLEFDGGTLDKPKTLRKMWLTRSRNPDTSAAFVAVTSTFWRWLREKRGASFAKSLVYVDACSTDETPDLRDAVQAKAYFAYTKEEKVGVGNAVRAYLVQSLGRRTRTAEEVYYNILRVASTRLMIYKEDKLLDLELPALAHDFAHASTLLKGYAFDGQEVVSYQSAGWLKAPHTNPGSIWWLLFAARWSPDAAAGARSLKDCWDKYWSQGLAGGLAAPGCNSMAPSNPGATAEDIAYASYLLTGQPVLDAPVFKIPRWTLNEAR